MVAFACCSVDFICEMTLHQTNIQMGWHLGSFLIEFTFVVASLTTTRNSSSEFFMEPSENS